MGQRVAIVCGEMSGDILGADLIRALRIYWPEATFEGVGGPKMIAAGFKSHFHMDRLAVMGLVEPLKRLPELLRMRKSLIKRYREDPPTVFIGIDSPDFTTNIELALRTAGIKTVHYVSPSVWAWRKGRIHKIKRADDLMLTLLPFEADFYRQHKVPVEFVGHPLADQIIPKSAAEARTELDLPLDAEVLTLMPGSRGSEVALMSRDYLDAAAVLVEQGVIDSIVIPAANDARYTELVAILAEYDGLPVKLIRGQSQLAMSASSVVLLTSGTTALEAMLLNRPMVVAYRTSAVSFFILSKLVDTPFIALPNLIAGEALVPEVIQSEVTVERLVTEVVNQLQNSEQLARFSELTQLLQQGGSAKAAKAIVSLCSP
ncbi:lipid-A-disaccharide synthase [Umboniibacter marinipuniceus]|uniref:Lipid-A-disaccharide synthase n=1 Tax=Umboniibacter marinipuniceus TaxID=569599 RepID=A0A3M0A8E8_9GAMM|nr:lipid-A-disaccharide synthase [Umboniibacter marinipuniceus]RMA78685.1 lipid-A-disaccharide synthase [Umboniibacter marinipuniceus]